MGSTSSRSTTRGFACVSWTNRYHHHHHHNLHSLVPVDVLLSPHRGWPGDKYTIWYVTCPVKQSGWWWCCCPWLIIIRIIIIIILLWRIYSLQRNPDANCVDKKQTTTPMELTWWGRWYRAWLGSSINYNIIHGMSSSSTCGLHEHRRHYGNHPRLPSTHSLILNPAKDRSHTGQDVTLMAVGAGRLPG